MTNAKMQTFALMAIAVFLAVGVTSFVYFRVQAGRDNADPDHITQKYEYYKKLYDELAKEKKEAAEAKKDSGKLTEKLGENTVKIKPGNLKNFDLKMQTAEDVTWHPRIFVDGRVLPNPQATVEVRAPFAGVVAPGAVFRLGMAVAGKQTLASFEARFSPLEKLDLKAKSVEAETRYKASEGVLKLRQEQSDLLGQNPAVISRGDYASAAIQLSEARMARDIALAQWDLWKQAVESAGKKNIVVPINAPIGGEITEIGAQPGANVEAGQLLVRIVDFSRVLVRLDFPLSGQAPPADLDNLEAPTTWLVKPNRWPAHMHGGAPSVEIGLQKASYLYEIMPRDKRTPNWRPGMYVRGLIADPARKSESALKVPASAVLVHQGTTWVYVQIGESGTTYRRCEVAVIDRVDDTLIIAGGGAVNADDRVVSQGAQKLLSEEFRMDVDDD
jgi:hypothetical protein